MEGNDLIGLWLAVIERVPPKGWGRVDAFDSLPARVRGDSSMWSERFFTPAADPTKQVQAERFHHFATAETPDLLLHRFQTSKARLDVVESINFFIVRVVTQPSVLDLPVAQRAAHVNGLAAFVLRLEGPDHRWQFDLSQPLEEGVRFSSNANADPLHLPSWTTRVDGGVRRGALYFLCYKKFFDLAGFRDVDTWYDDSYRRQRTLR